jgi:PBP1b-binding outer membrane lipoprotein LpoB
MNKRLASYILLILIIVFVVSCSKSYSANDPVPQSVIHQIKELREFSNELTEWVPNVITSTMIIENAALERGNIGDVCRAIAIAEVDLEVNNSGDSDYSRKATNTARDQVNSMSETIKCDLVSLP